MNLLARFREAIRKPTAIPERSERERSALHFGWFIAEIVFVLGVLYVVLAR
jgi:hypothetical protein